MDGFGGAAEFAELGGIGFVLAADGGEGGEERAEDEAEAFVARIGAVGETGVDQEDWPVGSLGAPNEVGPDFGFDEDDGVGMDGTEGAVDEFAAVDGVIDFADCRREALLEFSHAGGGRGGDHDLEVGHARFECADDLHGDIHLAHADGVHPEHVTVGHGLLDLVVVNAKTLLEAVLPISPPPHFEEVVGGGKEEGDPE